MPGAPHEEHKSKLQHKQGNKLQIYLQCRIIMKSIRKRKEGSDQLIHEREERDEEQEWEPNVEDIEGIDNEQDNVTP